MGNILNRLFKRTRGRDLRILMLGLDNAGKTTILHKLKGSDGVVSEKEGPTVGYNLETLIFKSLKFDVWDVGGQEKIRNLWQHYYAGTSAIIFVIDAACHERLNEARSELYRTVQDVQLRGVPFLIFANKSDVSGAMTKEELSMCLELDSLKGHEWCVMPSCAKTGDGLSAGFDWLVTTVEANDNNNTLINKEA